LFLLLLVLVMVVHVVFPPAPDRYRRKYSRGRANLRFAIPH